MPEIRPDKEICSSCLGIPVEDQNDARQDWSSLKCAAYEYKQYWGNVDFRPPVFSPRLSPRLVTTCCPYFLEQLMKAQEQ